MISRSVKLPALIALCLVVLLSCGKAKEQINDDNTNGKLSKFTNSDGVCTSSIYFRIQNEVNLAYFEVTRASKSLKARLMISDCDPDGFCRNFDLDKDSDRVKYSSYILDENSTSYAWCAQVKTYPDFNCQHIVMVESEKEPSKKIEKRFDVNSVPMKFNCLELRENVTYLKSIKPAT